MSSDGLIVPRNCGTIELGSGDGHGYFFWLTMPWLLVPCQEFGVVKITVTSLHETCRSQLFPLKCLRGEGEGYFLAKDDAAGSSPAVVKAA